VFAGTAAAQFFRIYGTITDAEGNPYVGHEVIIKKQHDIFDEEAWLPLNGTSITNDTGYYDTGWCYYRPYGNPVDNYRMYIDGDLVAERYIGEDDWDKSTFCWSYRWDYQYQIPEFATIAIPAVAVLGLFLFYNHRKRKEE